MSADATEVEVESQARERGWRPKGEFKGQESSWVDAETYLRRAEEVLPIMRADNRRMREELTQVKSESQATREALKAATEAIEELKSFNTDVAKRGVKAQKEQIMTQLTEAKTSGNVELEVQLTDKLSELNASLRESAREPTVKPTPAATQPTLTPEVKQWLTENPWFGSDKRRTGLAFGIADDLKAQGKVPNLEFYEEIGREVEKLMPSGNGQRREAPARVSGSNGSEGGGGGPRGKTFADLPADAKAACDRQGTEKLVGTGKVFKDKSAWRQHYADIYFSE